MVRSVPRFVLLLLQCSTACLEVNSTCAWKVCHELEGDEQDRHWKKRDIVSHVSRELLPWAHLCGSMTNACPRGDKMGELGIDDLHGAIVYKYGTAACGLREELVDDKKGYIGLCCGERSQYKQVGGILGWIVVA